MIEIKNTHPYTVVPCCYFRSLCYGYCVSAEMSTDTEHIWSGRNREFCQ